MRQEGKRLENMERPLSGPQDGTKHAELGRCGEKVKKKPEEIMAEYFPNLMNPINSQLQEAQLATKRVNTHTNHVHVHHNQITEEQ